jgi:hypothetical protein
MVTKKKIRRQIKKNILFVVLLFAVSSALITFGLFKGDPVTVCGGILAYGMTMLLSILVITKAVLSSVKRRADKTISNKKA